MNKTQINFRASDLTRVQLDRLGERWGTTQTETLTVAIDRVCRAELTGDPGAGDAPALYELLSDAALALVGLPRWQDRNTALTHFAGELVAFGVQAGLTLGELRALAVSLQNELTDAIAHELSQPVTGGQGVAE